MSARVATPITLAAVGLADITFWIIAIWSKDIRWTGMGVLFIFVFIATGVTALYLYDGRD